MFGQHADRVVWDRDWEAWIVERYGSIANAEKDWAIRRPARRRRQDHQPARRTRSSPTASGGAWSPPIGGSSIRCSTRSTRPPAGSSAASIPTTCVSFRMTEAGNPTCTWDGMIPYDFPYLVNAVDFLAPEAYGRIGDWEKVKPGWFEREYARWADPGKPMIWAEMGMSTWDASLAGNSPQPARQPGRLLPALLPHDDRQRRRRHLLLVVSRRLPLRREQRLRHHQPRRQRSAGDQGHPRDGHGRSSTAPTSSPSTPGSSSTATPRHRHCRRVYDREGRVLEGHRRRARRPACARPAPARIRGTARRWPSATRR